MRYSLIELLPWSTFRIKGGMKYCDHCETPLNAAKKYIRPLFEINKTGDKRMKSFNLEFIIYLRSCSHRNGDRQKVKLFKTFLNVNGLSCD